MNDQLLKVNNLNKSFGGVDAVKHVSFETYLGKIVSIIGPNGAGKTTVLNLISSTLKPDSGEIWRNGNRLDLLPPHEVARLGVSRTFQNIQLFENMTVLENVMIGHYRHERTGFIHSALGLTKAETKNTQQAALHWLTRVGIANKAELPARKLSLGEQRLLEISRALATRPSLLLLDEPTSGLNHTEKIQLTATIHRIRANNISILLIEHDMDVVMNLSDLIVVLNFGEVIAIGTPEEIQSNPLVINTYLGQVD